MDQVTLLLKIVLNKCYVNKYNLYNQVGVIAINCMGEMFNQPSTSSIPQSLNQSVVEHTARTLSARQGPPQMLQDLNTSMGPSLDEELNIDKSTLETLKGLYAAKERAVINEDFDEAKKLKVSIDRLKAISGHLG